MKRFKFISKSLRVLLAFVSAMVFAANSSAQVLDADNANVRAVIAVQNVTTRSLMSLQEILGTAVGLDAQGQLSLVVYVNRGSANAALVANALPTKIRGVNVTIEMTEPFKAFAGKPSSGGGTTVSHTALQAAPIQLGTSGGWTYDLANGYCCGGTLGSLVTVNGAQYILSNYHVFEADIVSGGNTRIAQFGDPVIQPGLIDVSCNAAGAQSVATLSGIKSLPNNNVDVGLAQVVSGMVQSNGAILEIGTISTSTVAASLNQKVKKSGRTTGLSRSTVAGLNATVSVAYENECAGGAAFTKTFTGQIVISNRGSKFLNSGDSGSLMVEDVSTNPRAVGLLYAGSSTAAIANPIDEVLTFIGTSLGGTATMVGQ